jgi:ATP-dependent Clp protease ATP-binding subunit ClpC
VFERFTERARNVVVLAQQEAMELRHPDIGTAHLMLGLALEEDGVAGRVLETLGVTAEDLRARVVKIAGMGRKPVDAQLPFTPDGKRALEEAGRVARGMGHSYVGTEHILLGVAAAPKGIAARILRELGLDADRLRGEVDLVLAEGSAPPERDAGGAGVTVTVPCPACGRAIEQLGLAATEQGAFAAERSGDVSCPHCDARYDLRYRIDWTPR